MVSSTPQPAKSDHRTLPHIESDVASALSRQWRLSKRMYGTLTPGPTEGPSQRVPVGARFRRFHGSAPPGSVSYRTTDLRVSGSGLAGPQRDEQGLRFRAQRWSMVQFGPKEPLTTLDTLRPGGEGELGSDPDDRAVLGVQVRRS